jgi:hypothetical protein
MPGYLFVARLRVLVANAVAGNPARKPEKLKPCPHALLRRHCPRGKDFFSIKLISKLARRFHFASNP